MNNFLKKDKRFFVTTPIYYPNSNLHIGHAYTTVLADVISKYKKIDGYDIYFLTGSDEHGEKIFSSAEKAKKNTKEFIDEIVENFKLLWEKLGINYDHFIRTTDKVHSDFVAEYFSKLLNSGEIYKGKYSGLYCIHDEEYFTETQIKNNKCPNCGRELKIVEENTYFLNVKKYKEWIDKILKDGNLLFPNSRANELIKGFLPDLQDLSITRENLKWGIKVNEDNDHTIYVWFDALHNYLSTFKYEKSKWKLEEIWNKNSKVEILQIIGKEITRFHAIYWPIILKMYDYKMPTILSHGWIVDLDGKKMSKSMGNSISPIELIDKYGRDAIRFFLISNISLNEDGKYSEELLKRNFNGILVNKYSNLINRMIVLFFKNTNGILNGKPNVFKEEEKKLSNLMKEFKTKMDSYSFFEASKVIISYLDKINEFIDKEQIWKIEDVKKRDSYFYFIFTQIWNISILFSPILIDSTKKVLYMFDENKMSFEDWNKDFNEKELKRIDFIFKRI